MIGIDGGDLRLIARDASTPVFSPDGTRIAYIAWHGDTRSVETVAADGTDRRTLVAPNIDALSLDFSPDGDRLVAAERLRRRHVTRIAIIDVRSGERTRLPAHATGDVEDAAWSPDGRRIAFVHFDSSQVFTIRPDGTGKRLAFTARVPAIEMLAWQPRPLARVTDPERCAELRSQRPWTLR